MSDKPLVSCVCPTWNRARYLPGLIECYFSQTWPEKELIIIDDSDKPVYFDSAHASIRYYRLENRLNIPEKRNLCARYAQGKYIAHFDDDDWSAPDRIERQMRHMAQFNVGITGFHSILFWNEITREVWQYQGSPGYACGTSFFYRKAFWAKNRFNEEQPLGSDNSIIYPARDRNEVATFDGGQLLVARIHENQSNYKDLTGDSYRRLSTRALPEDFPRN